MARVYSWFHVRIEIQNENCYKSGDHSWKIWWRYTGFYKTLLKFFCVHNRSIRQIASHTLSSFKVHDVQYLNISHPS